jgi:acyl-CoA synthetase (AMP-forming)/AMP-acid ligase II
MGPRTRYFTGMPLGSAAGYGSMLAALAAGGAVILPGLSADFVELANALGVTLTNGPPALLAELMARADRHARRLETMEYFEVLGAHLPRALAREAISNLTPNIWTVYGSTETDRIAHANAATCIDDPSAVGYVTPWTEAEIVDADDEPLPAGHEGQLRVRGPQVIDGYFKDETATRRNFRNGWFYPGDIGAIDDAGLLRVTGRVEEVIRRDGGVVSPLPIEEAMRGLPGVRDVAVFALTASGAEQVCAALVLDAGADVARIRTEAAARLGDQTPARLFVIDKLPRNANGKVMRRELVAMAQRAGGALAP